MLSLVKAGTAKWLKLEVKRAVKIVIAKEMVKKESVNGQWWVVSGDCGFFLPLTSYIVLAPKCLPLPLQNNYTNEF